MTDSQPGPILVYPTFLQIELKFNNTSMLSLPQQDAKLQRNNQSANQERLSRVLT